MRRRKHNRPRKILGVSAPTAACEVYMPQPHPYRDFECTGWEGAASAYAATFEHATSLFVPALADAVSARPGARILDVACGTGCFAAEVVARGATAVAVDFSAAMVAQGRRLHPRIEFEVADAEALPLPDAAFDAVGINFGVHHFPFPVRALKECLRTLRPGGRLAFTVWASPHEHALHQIALTAVRRSVDASATLPLPPEGQVNSPEVCVQLLQQAGFTRVAAEIGKVAAVLDLESVAALQHLIQAGTVRMAALIASQPAEKRAAILAAIADEAAKYRIGTRLAIPVVALLACVTK